jgi:hypothetical protein
MRSDGPPASLREALRAGVLECRSTAPSPNCTPRSAWERLSETSRAGTPSPVPGLPDVASWLARRSLLEFQTTGRSLPRSRRSRRSRRYLCNSTPFISNWFGLFTPLERSPFFTVAESAKIKAGHLSLTIKMHNYQLAELVNNLAITYKNLPRYVICIHRVGLTRITGSWSFEPPESALPPSVADCFRNDPIKIGAQCAGISKSISPPWRLRNGYLTASRAFFPAAICIQVIRQYSANPCRLRCFNSSLKISD